MKFKLIIICTIYSFVTNAQSNIREQLQNYIKPYKAEVGIGIKIAETNDTIFINNSIHFPMMSVYKFHLALYILNEIDKGHLELNQKVVFQSSDLFSSSGPLVEKYPNKKGEVIIKDLLNYVISYSDNNSCDLLFKLINGPKNVEYFLYSLREFEVSIKWTEKQKHKKRSRIYDNWTTPRAMVKLLDDLQNRVILEEESRSLIMRFMIENYTGGMRLKSKLPSLATVAHKTGTSDINKKGVFEAINDVGIIDLNNGSHLIISVFVKDSKETFETNEKIIADIAKIAYDYYNNR